MEAVCIGVCCIDDRAIKAEIRTLETIECKITLKCDTPSFGSDLVNANIISFIFFYLFHLEAAENNYRYTCI